MLVSLCKSERLLLFGMSFSIILLILGVFFILQINLALAATTFGLDSNGLPNDMMEGGAIKSSSDPTGAIRFKLNTDAGGGAHLTSVSVAFSGQGFSTTSLEALTTASSSGVALYTDNGTDTGIFDSNDSVMTLTSVPVWGGTSTPVVTITNFQATSTLPQNTDVYFYVVIRTSAIAQNNSIIETIIPQNGITTTDGNGPTFDDYVANIYLVDTQAPSILSVDKVNSMKVEVVFSEMMDFMDGPPQTSDFNFSGGINTTDVMMEGPGAIRVVGDSEVTVGSTTMTVSGSLTDFAGNALISTSSIAITNPKRIKISEISADMGHADSEFIELYNASEVNTSINNWLIQYSAAANGSTWTTLATTTGSIPGYSFFLLSTTLFDSGSDTDGDINFTSGSLPLTGGHVRIYDGNNTVDKIGWGTAVSPEGTAKSTHGSGESLERKSFGMTSASDMAPGGMDSTTGNAWDTGDNSFDFVTQSNPSPQNSLSDPESFMDGMGMLGPMINHMPPGVIASNTPLTLYIQMGDPMTPINEMTAELHYMAGDGSPSNNTTGDYTIAVGTHIANGYHRFTVPQNVISTSVVNGLYYYLKLTTNNQTMLMSNSPDADMSNNESQVAQNPFEVTVEQPGTQYTISGSVTLDATTTQSGVLVILEGTGYSTTTDASGNYSINAENGVYNIVFVREGYYEERIDDVFVNGGGVTVPSRTMYEGTGGGMTGDSENPMVLWTNPCPDGCIAPAGDDQFLIFFGFSKDIDPTTFSTSTVILSTDGSTPIAGYSVAFNPSRTGYMPPANTDPYLGVIYPPSTVGLDANTTYYVKLQGLRDTSGNSLQSNNSDGSYVFTFMTGSDLSGETWDDFGSGAVMPPFVVDEKPVMGSTNNPQNTKISFKFSEAMDEGSVTTAGNLKLYKVTISGTTEVLTPVSITTAMNSTKKIAIMTPTSNLTAGKYKAVVTGALKSAQGIWMGDPGQSQNVDTYEFFTSKFEVGSNIDTTALTVSGSWPMDGDTGIPVNPGSFEIYFSENLDPSTVDTNSVKLKRGSTVVNSTVYYDPKNYKVELAPNSVLATNVLYTIYISGNSTSTGVTDLSGNAITATTTTISFTTDTVGDTVPPEIMFGNGDEYGMAITFSEPMNATLVTDTSNWGASVLNPSNYLIKYGDPSTNWSSGGTVVDFSSAKLMYESTDNTVMIDNIGLDWATVSGMDYYVNMSTSSATDLSGNIIASSSMNTFQMPINNSIDTQGMLGPSMTIGPDMGDMGMMMSGVFPMNGMAGQITTYFVDIPTTKVIPPGGKIKITFPTGFDVSSAQKDPYSPINDDINEWNEGVVTIASIVGTTTNRMITITTSGASTTQNDYLHMDISGIVNSSIARDFNTEGYSAAIKTFNQNDVLLETVNTMPFFINEGGSASLVVTVAGIQAADVNGSGDTVDVYLGSPMTGPMDKQISIDNDGNGSTTFSGLPTGNYMIFTEPLYTLDGNDYAGNPMPEPIWIVDGVNNKTVTLAKEGVGAGKAQITVNITGSFGTDNIDIFASSPNSFKVKTVENAGDNPSANLYLTDGDWMVGMGPAMPKGPMAGPPPMPDWMTPMPVNVKVSNSGSSTQENSDTANDGTIELTVSSANKNIIGYVKDGSGNAISSAEVWAYQPMGSGMGSNTKTDTNGMFTLKISEKGNYKVGTSKPGLPFVPERSVVVKDDTGNVATDGNSTADVYRDGGSLITTASPFVIKIKKPANIISGKVTDGTNPVSYAPVWADRTDGMGHADTMTDSSGNYIIYVDNGTWNLNAYIPDYGDAETKQVVVSGADETQNLNPNTSNTYYTISGTVGISTDATYSTIETPFTSMPIKAVEFDVNGAYQGREYGGITDSSGNYSIQVPAGIYRVDIWTPEYGELGVNNQDQDDTLNEATDDDKYANNPAMINANSGNVSNADIVVPTASLRTISLYFDNAVSNQEGFINVDGIGYDPGDTNYQSQKPTGFHYGKYIPDLSATTTIQLADGDYAFFLDVPGVGSFIPDDSSNSDGRDADKDLIVVSGDRNVDFTLTDLTSGAVTISGTVYDTTATSGNELADVWVWIGNPENGYHNGAQTNGSGSYSIVVPIGNGYKMGADKPGFMSGEPTDMNISTTTTKNFTLTSYNLSISGYIYADANSNSSWDSGEEVSNGFVRAETEECSNSNTSDDDQCVRSHSPVDGSGTYELGVVNGTWKIYGMADGYQETEYFSTVTVSGSSKTANIKLTANSNWSGASKKAPMTPASGGSMDDTAPGGTGVKLTIPPNALGNSSASGNVNANKTSSVTQTNSSDPVGGEGVNITATDNSGQAITNLNDYIDVEMVLYKSDVDQAISDGDLTYSKLKNTNNSYWDSTTNDWVTMATTRKAYYKTSGDATEWTLYANSATTSSAFVAFIDELVAGSIAPADYKLVFTSKTNHLTVFAVIMPFVAQAAAPAPDPNPPAPAPDPNPPAPGGGGSSGVSLCSTVTWGTWGACISGMQYKNILSTVPTNCTLTELQENERKRACVATEETAEIETTAQTVSGDELYKGEAQMVFEANVTKIIEILGLEERNQEGEILSRGTLINKLGIDLGKLEPGHQYALTNFITYGSPATEKLGWGERAGVINSFMAAFGNIPKTDADWQDIIKIANGRWPTQRNEKAENNALIQFRKIYLRDPDRSNPHDDAAITVIAYGLRPVNRNLESEKAAIRIFRGIYKYSPAGATDWDIVRAIAYSGAAR